jgi:hypothetical protein
MLIPKLKTCKTEWNNNDCLHEPILVNDLVTEVRPHLTHLNIKQNLEHFGREKIMAIVESVNKICHMKLLLLILFNLFTC